MIFTEKFPVNDKQQNLKSKESNIMATKFYKELLTTTSEDSMESSKVMMVRNIVSAGRL